MQHLEIERKFLVSREKWANLQKPAGVVYMQGYLSIDDQKVIRARVAGDQGYLTIKGASETYSRPEFEYAIPAEEAAKLIELFAKSAIRKIRTKIPAGRHTWEVDEFLGDNEGLLLAEIELSHADEPFEMPNWIDREVTGDIRYHNSRLSENPFRSWGNR